MANTEKKPPSPPSQATELQAQQLYPRSNGGVIDIAGCVSTTHTSHGQRKGSVKRRRRKELGVWGTLRTSIVHHQIGISVNLLLLLTFAHLCLPAVRPITSQFFQLQYYDSQTSTYLRGTADIPYVCLWIVIFTGLRELTMTYLLHPITSLLGMTRQKEKTRFAEQAWLFIYAAVFWSMGMYLYTTSEYWLDLPKMWSHFPDRQLTGLMKFYYLAQFAFWLQQIVVVNIEERRKDHWQMFTHHIVTSLLLFCSYGFYQTKVGNVVLCLMDIVDILLAGAKMLKYAGFQTACDVAFGVFIFSWFMARHVGYLLVCWSVYTDARDDVMKFGCYSSRTGELISATPPLDNTRFTMPSNKTENTPVGGTDIWTNMVQPFAHPNQPVCYNSHINLSFLALLLFLQGITVMWFAMILRVAYRVLKGQGADDSRSDDEGEDDLAEYEEFTDDEEITDVTDVEPAKVLKPVEQVVGVEGLNIARKSSPMSRFRGMRKEGQGSSSGIGVKKEILNRIGCDKPMD